MANAEDPHLIGWKERVSFPEWGIENVSAKSDSGARSSALDVRGIVELPDGRVEFDVILERGSTARTRRVAADITDHVTIRSSNGQISERYRIRTLVRVGGIEKMAEFSLATRRKMIHRVLLGRTFLAPEFLVDCSRRFVLSEPPTKKKRVRRPRGARG